MKTIAISIEESILVRIDRLALSVPGGSRNRSQIIREAVREYLNHTERMAEDKRDGEILKKHKARLSREAAALVKEQAKP